MQFFNIGSTIKEYRKSNNLTQQELASKVGITRQTLSKLEKGEIPKISLATFIKILDTLNLELEISEKKPFYYFDSKSIKNPL